MASKKELEKRIEGLQESIRKLRWRTTCFPGGCEVAVGTLLESLLKHLDLEIKYSPERFELYRKE